MNRLVCLLLVLGIACWLPAGVLAQDDTSTTTLPANETSAAPASDAAAKVARGSNLAALHELAAAAVGLPGCALALQFCGKHMNNTAGPQCQHVASAEHLGQGGCGQNAK